MKKDFAKMLTASLNKPSPMWEAFVLEPKRKPWVIRTDFDKTNAKHPKVDYASLRFKRKKDAIAFMDKIHALYKKEKLKK